MHSEPKVRRHTPKTHSFSAYTQEEKIPDGNTPCVQCALLYTTVFGQRRIRVLTVGLLATASIASVYRYADLDAVCNVRLEL